MASHPEPCVVLPDAGLPRAWNSFAAKRRYTNVWLDMYIPNREGADDAIRLVDIAQEL